MSTALPGTTFILLLWDWLTAPSPRVQLADGRRKARILANMLLIALPLGLGGVLAPFIIGGVPDIRQIPEFWFAGISFLITLIAYSLSRSVYYKLGALIAILNTWIMIFLVMGLTPFTDQHGFFYLVIPVLLSGVFLSNRITVVVAVTNILGIYMFSLTRADVSIIDLSVTLSFNIIMYPLMFLAFHQRAFLEVERQRQAQTEKLQAETLRIELDKERQLGDLRNQFMTMISHEFRTPLATILASTQILERYRDRMDQEKQANYFTIIQEQIHRLTRMIEDVLLLSRLASGQIHLEPAHQNIVHFCKAIIGGMHLEPERIKLNIRVAGEEKAYFDPDALEAILKKLVGNAVKYSAPDSVVEVELSPSPQALGVRIEDHGIGIPPTDQVRLYEPFYRGGNISNIPGTGLGMSIVKHYVDLMDGQISVDSQLERGTTFELHLPLCPEITKARQKPLLPTDGA